MNTFDPGRYFAAGGPPRVVVGCMSGTSLDGLDAAAVRLAGAGLEAEVELLATGSWAFGGPGDALRAIAAQTPMPAGAIAEAAWRFGEFHAQCIAELLRASAIRPGLIAVHGQTVFHRPPVSWQLLNPAPIARTLGVPVVFDLRQADLAAGGQGAPITPIADAVLFRRAGDAFAVANLGGFCNVTIVRRGAGGTPAVEGRDVCACNQVLDAVARAALHRPFDANGDAALSGRPDPAAREELAALLRAQAAAGRSLGTGDEAASWIERHAARLRGADLAATACESIGGCIADAVRGRAATLILAGGGTRNRALARAVESACDGRVMTSDALGVPAPMREAMAMAVLGDLCRQREPITLAAVTGRRDPAPVSGHWVLP